MKIPFLNLKRSLNELKSEINEAFSRVIQGGNFILGEEVNSFEKEWSLFCRAKGTVGVANGTEAITLALIGSGVIQKEARNEVITTPLSAAYTDLGIINAGAEPVFVDLDEKTYNLDPNRIEAAITPHTRAIVPVHLYGQTADRRAINEIAKRHNLIVIEDAAQAHGVEFNGKTGENQSLAMTFSFYPTKNLGALGDGGAVVSDDLDFLDQIRSLRQGGHFEALQTDLVGRNSRLDELQAAVLRVKLKKLKEWNLRRRELAEIYFEKLKSIPDLQLPIVTNNGHHFFHLFVIRHPHRDKLKNFLGERGVETLIHYPYLLSEQKIFSFASKKSLPVAKRIVKEILSLPLYPQMKIEEVEIVCQIIEEFENKKDSAFLHHTDGR